MHVTLFLAEDDEEDRELFMYIISEISPNIKVYWANNGINFMSMLEKATELPDFIFLDLNMPLKSGFECLREIKGSEKWNSINTIILSTSSHPEQINELYNMGANFYLVKPNSYKVFKEILTNCLQMEWGSIKQF